MYFFPISQAIEKIIEDKVKVKELFFRFAPVSEIMVKRLVKYINNELAEETIKEIKKNKKILNSMDEKARECFIELMNKGKLPSEALMGALYMLFINALIDYVKNLNTNDEEKVGLMTGLLLLLKDDMFALMKKELSKPQSYYQI